MISSSQIKFVQSLKQKKYRDLQRCFLAEGSKLVLELIGSRFPIRQIYADEGWILENPLPEGIPAETVKSIEMERLSVLASPSPVLAVAGMAEERLDATFWQKDLTLVLDGIRDPGNLGTIIRIADWFGIRQVICSTDCVDLYNPKVIQATMGSIIRVQVIYLDLPRFLSSQRGEVSVYGMTLDGENIYQSDTKNNGFLIIGSEAHGISEAVSEFVIHKISIPFYPSTRKTHAESLNAAVAMGIVCAEFRRKTSGRADKRTSDN